MLYNEHLPQAALNSKTPMDAMNMWYASHPQLFQHSPGSNRPGCDIYLPPYSPEINPDEYLNRDFKTTLRLSARSKSSNELLSKAETFMESLRKIPERVIRHFKKNPNIIYASI
jgi:hypothetical protein